MSAKMRTAGKRAIGLFTLVLATMFSSGAWAQEYIGMREVAQWGGQSVTVASAGAHAFVGAGHRLMVFDLTDPANPAPVGQTPALPSPVLGVAVANGYAYTANDWSGLRVFDVDPPQTPTLVAELGTGGPAYGVTVAGGYLYVADGERGLQIYDISVPDAPSLEGECDTPGEARDVAVEGGYVSGYAYVADGGGGFHIVDVSLPGSPAVVGSLGLPGYACGVAVQGWYAYVVTGWGNEVHVISLTDPQGPLDVGSFHSDVECQDVAVTGDYAYVANSWFGLTLFDITDPQNPTPAGGLDTQGMAWGVALSGTLALVADRSHGLQVMNVAAPPSVTWLGEYPGGIDSASDVALDGTEVYMTDGGGGAGMKCIDATDPSAPACVGTWTSYEHAWGLAYANDLVYIADGCAGLAIVETSDPQNPQERGRLETGCAARDVVVNGNYAYVADDAQTLLIIDVTNPDAPFLVAQWHNPQTPGYALGIAFGDHYVYIANDEPGLHIIDVADPYNPVHVGTYDTDGLARDVVVVSPYAYVADDWGGLLILDVSNPYTPTFVGRAEVWEAAQSVTVQYPYAYVAAGGMGVQVFDIADPAAPARAAFFDTPGFARRLALAFPYVYIADGDNGLVIASFVDFLWIDPAGGGFGEPDNWAFPGPPPAGACAFYILPDTYAVGFDGDYEHGRAVVHNGTVNLDLAGFTYTLTDDRALFVGELPGRTAVLSVANGTLAGRYASLAGQPGAAGELDIVGPGARFSLDPGMGYLDIGVTGAGSMSVTDGASADLYVTKLALWDGSEGYLSVGGPGSYYNINDLLLVGERDHGFVEVWDDADVTATWLVAGDKREDGGAVVGAGEVAVMDPGSRLDLAHQAFIGMAGEGSLSIQNGGVATVGWETIIGVADSGVGHLRVESGGQLLSTGPALIGHDAGSWGDATITDTDSALHMTGPDAGLRVGCWGAGELTIAQDADLTVDQGWSFVATESGSTGTMTLTGPGSTFTDTLGPFAVGWAGEGTLNVLDGAAVEVLDGELWVGVWPGASGHVLVDHATITEESWYHSVIGDGGLGELEVRNGGSVSLSYTTVGSQPGVAGSVSVRDASTLLATNFLSAGREGDGTLTVDQAGLVSLQDGLLAGELAGGAGHVFVANGGGIEVSGPDNFLKIGDSGAGDMLIWGGGHVTNEIGTIATYFGSYGEVIVDGDGSTWSNFNNLLVGREDVGLLTIQNGGAVITPSLARIGELATGDGTVTVTDPGSLWDATGGEIWVAQDGRGVLDVLNDGDVQARALLAAVFAGSTGDVTVDGAGSTIGTSEGALIGREGVGHVYVQADGQFTVTDWLTIAEQPLGEGHVTVEAGGAAHSRGVAMGYWPGAQAYLTVTGPTSSFTSDAQVQVGYGATGELLVADGALLTSYKSTSGTGTAGLIAAESTAMGRATVAGGRWLMPDGALTVGWLGDGMLLVSDGGLVETATDAIIGRLPGSIGVATVGDADSLWTVGETLAVGGLPDAAGGDGTLNVNVSGLVQARSELLVWPTGEVNVAGGSLVVGPAAGPGLPDTVSIVAYGTLAGGGTVRAGAVHNAGVVAPGASTGILSIVGDYASGPGGELEVELGGASPGSGYDRLAISGAAQLAGTLQVTLAVGYEPAPNSAFDIVTCASRTGTFTLEQLPSVVTRRFRVFYGATAVTLRAFATGDMNCDGVVNALDINPFVRALTDPAAYNAQYPNCSLLNADCDGDGAVNALDINPFVRILTGG